MTIQTIHQALAPRHHQAPQFVGATAKLMGQTEAVADSLGYDIVITWKSYWYRRFTLNSPRGYVMHVDVKAPTGKTEKCQSYRAVKQLHDYMLGLDNFPYNELQVFGAIHP